MTTERNGRAKAPTGHGSADPRWTTGENRYQRALNFKKAGMATPARYFFLGSP